MKAGNAWRRAGSALILCVATHVLPAEAAAASSLRSQSSMQAESGGESRYLQGSFAHSQVAAAAPEQQDMGNLKAWTNWQPADAAIGAWAVETFAGDTSAGAPGIAGPGGLPPIAEGDMDKGPGGIMDPCPLLTDWPLKVDIDAPNPCNLINQHYGNWSASGTGTGLQNAGLMTWSQSCSPFGGGVVPTISYNLPGGMLFGTSQMAISVTGTVVNLADCTGFLRYRIHEKVYNVPGVADPVECEKYGACADTIYMQYFIHDWAGREIAHTPYLKLFQGGFRLEDKSGLLIAEAKRIGLWNPMSHTCKQGERRRWQIHFPDTTAGLPAGISPQLTSPADRWIVAELVTMIVNRDHHRQATGLVGTTACGAQKLGLLVIVLLFATAVTGGGFVFFTKVGLAPMQYACTDFEEKFCPRRMTKPTRPPQPAVSLT